MENLLAIEMRKTQILTNRPIYQVLSILDLNKALWIYEFCHDYVKPKYGENAKLCYMDIDSFVVYVKQIMCTNTLKKRLKQGLTLKRQSYLKENNDENGKP